MEIAMANYVMELHFFNCKINEVIEEQLSIIVFLEKISSPQINENE